jgi:multiple sugar transport system permease protein
MHPGNISMTVASPDRPQPAARGSRFAVLARHVSMRSTVIYALVIAIAIVTIFPFLWMVSTSLKSIAELGELPPSAFPREWLFSNYPDAWTVLPNFGRIVINTGIVTSLTIIGRVLSCSLTAFGFARLRFPGRNVLFLLVLGTMMLPEQVTIIPLYLLYLRVGWLNSWLPLIVPQFFGVPFYIFLLRQFFLTLPRDLDDAARIDGCSYYGVYWRVVLPLSRPALAAVAAFSFVSAWNDFFHPLIFLTDPEIQTLGVGLRNFVVEFQPNTNLLMAASTMAVLPILLVFLIAQKYFIQGIALTGVKG